MRFASWMIAAALTTLITMPTMAQQEGGKKKGGKGAGRTPAAQVMTKLKEANLTDQQTAKIKELGKAAGMEIKKLEQEGLTPELKRQLAAAAKEARDAGKKGNEVKQAVEASVQLTEQQKAAVAKSEAILVKFRKDVYALLSDTQKEALPAPVKRQLSGAPAKGKGKNKQPAQ